MWWAWVPTKDPAPESRVARSLLPFIRQALATVGSGRQGGGPCGQNRDSPSEGCLSPPGSSGLSRKGLPGKSEPPEQACPSPSGQQGQPQVSSLYRDRPAPPRLEIRAVLVRHVACGRVHHGGTPRVPTS